MTTAARPTTRSREFRATAAGHAELAAWMSSYGSIRAIGIEGTGHYGAALTRFLTAACHRVVEVNRPSPSARRANGKSDRLDAEPTARAVLGATATAVPKLKAGPIEVIRIRRVTRSSAIKARTQAFSGAPGSSQRIVEPATVADDGPLTAPSDLASSRAMGEAMQPRPRRRSRSPALVGEGVVSAEVVGVPRDGVSVARGAGDSLARPSGPRTRTPPRAPAQT
jgi:transposase